MASKSYKPNNIVRAGSARNIWQPSTSVASLDRRRAGPSDLRGGFLVKVVGCSLGMSGCRKDGTVIILEDFQPSRSRGS